MLRKTNFKRQDSILFLVLFAWLCQCLPTLSAEEWIGRKFMPKSRAKYMQEDIEISHQEIALPLTISEIKDDWIWVGKAWIQKQHVVPMEEAIAYYTEYLKTNPNDIWAYTARGISLEQKGKYDEAIMDYTKSIQLDPHYARAYNNRGTAWYNKGKYNYAIEDYTKAIQLNPTDSMPYSNRGAIWYYKKEYDNAILDYTKAIQVAPKNPNIYRDRATTWRKKGEYDNAIKDYTQAIQLDPNPARAYNDRGSVRYHKGEYDKAIEDYTEAIQLDPKLASAYNNLAWCFSTCPEAQYRDGQQAVITGRKACELSEWKHIDFIKTLAAAYAELGNFQQAMKYQKMCIKILDEDAKKKQEFNEQLKLYLAGKPYRHENLKDFSD